METNNPAPSLTLLIKLLKMTTSSHDAEALVACRKANQELQKFGGDWDTLLRGKVTVIGDPFENLRKPDPGRTAHPNQAPAPPPPPRPAAPPPQAPPRPRPAPQAPPKPVPPKPRPQPQPQPQTFTKPPAWSNRPKAGSIKLEDLI
jgi:outer membrane biosynthesis protein TonB